MRTARAIASKASQLRAAWQTACATADASTIGRAADGLFQHVPLLGWAIRAIKRRV